MEQFIIQLGIGGATLWILREHLLRSDKRIDSRDIAFVKFVETHNEKMVGLVVESTNAIKESTIAIKGAAEVICKVSNQILDNGKKKTKKRFDKCLYL